MWSMSSEPGSVKTSPVYGPFHDPDATLHLSSFVYVTGVSDSATSASCRASWQSPSSSTQ